MVKILRVQIRELKLLHSVRHDTVTPVRSETIFVADLIQLYLLAMRIRAGCKPLYVYIGHQTLDVGSVCEFMTEAVQTRWCAGALGQNKQDWARGRALTAQFIYVEAV